MTPLFVLATALASSPHPSPSAHPMTEAAHVPDHHGKHHTVVGVQAIEANAHLGGDHALVGAGAFIERSVGWIDLELSLHLLESESESTVPVEVLLKRPLHFTRAFAAFFTARGGVDIVSHRGERSVHPTSVFGTGLVGWFDNNVGLEGGVSYTVALDGGLPDELALAAGPAFRF